MDERQPDADLTLAVIVPARPGQLVRLSELRRGRDELDELLDAVFGEPDDRGPGAVDAILVAGGLAAIIGRDRGIP